MSERSVERAPGAGLSRTRYALFAAASVLIGFGVCLIALEIALRLSDWQVRYKHHIGGMHRYHPILGREQIPSWDVVIDSGPEEIHYHIDRHGFRDPDETTEARVPGVARIALLGDSLAWGWGVSADAMLSEQLEALTGAEVVNMAHVATGTGHQWLLLKEKGLAFAPDVVLLAFFVGNDYRNNLDRKSKLPQFTLRDDGGIEVGNVPVPRPLSARVSELLKRVSLSYFFIGYHFEVLRTAFQSGSGWLGDLSRALSTDEGDGGAWYGEFVDIYRAMPTPEMQRGYDLTEALIREIRAVADAHGIRLLLAVIPDRFQIEDDAWVALVEEVEEDHGPALDRMRPTRTCLEISARAGVDTVDLFPALRAAEATGPVHFPGDIHWNGRGHQVAAQAIHHALAARGWTPSRAGGGMSRTDFMDSSRKSGSK
jgi:hypothetical protein